MRYRGVPPPEAILNPRDRQTHRVAPKTDFHMSMEKLKEWSAWRTILEIAVR